MRQLLRIRRSPLLSAALDFVDTSAGPLHRVTYGGFGQPIVMIHGLGGSTTNFEVTGPMLTRHGQVSAIDLPGFGLSLPPDNYRLATHAAFIEAYLETLEGPAVLVGNSTGGLLSEIVASVRPDLVQRLILLSPATPPVLPDPRLDAPTALRLLVQATPILGEAVGRYLIRRFTPEELVHLTFEMVTYKPGHIPVELVEASIDIAHIRTLMPWAPEALTRTAGSIALTYLRRSQFVRMVRKITAPTLVVQGLADKHVSPTAVEWMCGLRPDWVLVQMSGTGHTPQMDAPLRLFEVLDDWLATSSTAAVGA